MTETIGLSEGMKGGQVASLILMIGCGPSSIGRKRPSTDRPVRGTVRREDAE